VPLGFLAAVFGIEGWRQGWWPAWFPLLVFLPFIADASATLLRRLITRHAALTGSPRARLILAEWDAYRPRFVKVMPIEYRRALAEMEKARTMQAAE